MALVNPTMAPQATELKVMVLKAALVVQLVDQALAQDLGQPTEAMPLHQALVKEVDQLPLMEVQLQVKVQVPAQVKPMEVMPQLLGRAQVLVQLNLMEAMPQVKVQEVVQDRHQVMEVHPLQVKAQALGQLNLMEETLQVVARVLALALQVEVTVALHQLKAQAPVQQQLMAAMVEVLLAPDKDLDQVKPLELMVAPQQLRVPALDLLQSMEVGQLLAQVKVLVLPPQEALVAPQVGPLVALVVTPIHNRPIASQVT